MRYLLDTSALLAHYRSERGASRVQEILDTAEAEVFISAPSIAEFARRAASLGAETPDARDAALEYAAVATRILPVDTAVAVRAFEIGSVCTARLPLIDALIAACASVSGSVLVHQDVHFDTIPEGLPAREML